MHSEKAEKVSYYNSTSIEVIDIIEALELPFSLGNAIKYISRCNNVNCKTDNIVSELDKVLYYINRELKYSLYTKKPFGGVVDNLVKFMGEIQYQLPQKVYLGLYWLAIFIMCNKINESKETKTLYLTRALENIKDYRDEILNSRNS